MYFFNKKLKIVIIDGPIMSLEELGRSGLFGQIIRCKIDSYSYTYDDRAQSLEIPYFLGTQIILCEEFKKKLIPIFSYTSTTLESSMKYNFEFPALTALGNNAHPSCKGDVLKIINGIKKLLRSVL
jgi:hypothetical protein